MLNINDFIYDMSACLDEFKSHWEKNHQNKPELFPTSLTSESEWMEHFEMFLEEKRSANLNR